MTLSADTDRVAGLQERLVLCVHGVRNEDDAHGQAGLKQRRCAEHDRHGHDAELAQRLPQTPRKHVGAEQAVQLLVPLADEKVGVRFWRRALGGITVANESASKALALMEVDAP